MTQHTILPFGEAEKYIGHIDELSTSRLSGWIKCPDTNERQSITIIFDNGKRKFAKANIFRQDLLDAGIGDGSFAFSVDISVISAGAKSVRISINKTNTMFPNGPYLLPIEATIVDHILSSPLMGFIKLSIDELEYKISELQQ